LDLVVFFSTKTNFSGFGGRERIIQYFPAKTASYFEIIFLARELLKIQKYKIFVKILSCIQVGCKGKNVQKVQRNGWGKIAGAILSIYSWLSTLYSGLPAWRHPGAGRILPLLCLTTGILESIPVFYYCCPRLEDKQLSKDEVFKGGVKEKFPGRRALFAAFI
jgi:hypothetical protein